jgi:hypothetical protein
MLSGALCGNKTFSNAALAKPNPTRVLKNNNAGFLAILPKSKRFASWDCQAFLVLKMGSSLLEKPRPYGSGKEVIVREPFFPLTSSSPMPINYR